MDRRVAIHSLLGVIAFEALSFIKESEAAFENRWVSATHIKASLDLNFVAVPIDNKQYGEKGWFFGIIARILEDDKLVEYKKDGNRAFYRTYSLNKI